MQKSAVSAGASGSRYYEILYLACCYGWSNEQLNNSSYEGDCIIDIRVILAHTNASDCLYAQHAVS